MGIVDIVVDVALSTSWWIVRKTTYGLYTGVAYLIWGHIESNDDIQRRQFMEQLERDEQSKKQLIKQMEYQKQLLIEMKSSIANNEVQPDEDPPTYEESIDPKNSEDIKIESDNNSTMTL